MDGEELNITKEVIAKLKESFKDEENVLLAYLFGSRAKSKGSFVSDYDIAVLLRRRGLRELGEVVFMSSKALGVNEDLIDVLDLAEAPLHLKAKVLTEGIKLIDRGYEKALKLEVNIKYPEIAPQMKGLLRHWAENPYEVDLKLVKDRLDYLLHTSSHIKSFLERHERNALLEDFEAWHALKSMVQDSIQYMIDVCAHVFSSKDLGIASSYREYVEKLAGRGYMDAVLAEDLKVAIMIRNRLIHRYLMVKLEELWDFAFKLTSELVQRFKKWALDVVKA